MSDFTAAMIVIAASLMGAVVTLVIRGLVGIEFRRRHHDVGSVVFLQLGVVFAVLLAFVFNEAWSEYNDAAQAIGREVAEMHGASMIASTLPTAQAENVLTAEEAYLRSVVDREWTVMTKDRGMDTATEQKLAALIGIVANLQLTAIEDQGKKNELLSLLAQAHADREARLFQADSGIPYPLWMVLIGLTLLLTLFVAFSGIAHRGSAMAMAACFVASIVGILVIAQLLDYPFEGGLALSSDSFASVAGKVSVILGQVSSAPR